MLGEGFQGVQCACRRGCEHRWLAECHRTHHGAGSRHDSHVSISQKGVGHGSGHLRGSQASISEGESKFGVWLREPQTDF